MHWDEVFTDGSAYVQADNSIARPMGPAELRSRFCGWPSRSAALRPEIPCIREFSREFSGCK
jgi:hypothetical protein